MITGHILQIGPTYPSRTLVHPASSRCDLLIVQVWLYGSGHAQHFVRKVPLCSPQALTLIGQYPRGFLLELLSLRRFTEILLSLYSRCITTALSLRGLDIMISIGYLFMRLCKYSCSCKHEIVVAQQENVCTEARRGTLACQPTSIYCHSLPLNFCTITNYLSAHSVSSNSRSFFFDYTRVDKMLRFEAVYPSLWMCS